MISQVHTRKRAPPGHEPFRALLVITNSFHLDWMFMSRWRDSFSVIWELQVISTAIHLAGMCCTHYSIHVVYDRSSTWSAVQQSNIKGYGAVNFHDETVCSEIVINAGESVACLRYSKHPSPSEPCEKNVFRSTLRLHTRLYTKKLPCFFLQEQDSIKQSSLPKLCLMQLSKFQ